MMEAHGTAEVDLSLQSPEAARGLEEALVVSYPLRNLLAERYLL